MLWDQNVFETTDEHSNSFYTASVWVEKHCFFDWHNAVLFIKKKKHVLNLYKVFLLIFQFFILQFKSLGYYVFVYFPVKTQIVSGKLRKNIKYEYAVENLSEY